MCTSIRPYVNPSVCVYVCSAFHPSMRPSERNKCPKLTSKRRTDLKICVPEAKFVKESDFDVKSGVAPPKSTENDEKRISEPKNFVDFFVQRRKIESCKSSETRFPKV